MPKTTKTFKREKVEVRDGLTWFTYSCNIGEVSFASNGKDSYIHTTNIRTRPNLVHLLISTYHDIVMNEGNTEIIEVSNG